MVGKAIRTPLKRHFLVLESAMDQVLVGISNCSSHRVLRRLLGTMSLSLVITTFRQLVMLVEVEVTKRDSLVESPQLEDTSFLTIRWLLDSI